MNFLKTFLAALLAVVVANVVTFVLGVLLIVGIVAAVSTGLETKTTTHGSVLRIDLVQGVTDQPAEQPLGRRMRLNSSNSMWEVLSALEHAATDPAIETVLIDVTGGGVTTANVEELRAALLRFKESGKRVVAWSESYSQLEYYLASAADEVCLHPEGSVEWKGVASQVLFYKGLLDKLGVGVEVVRHGSFKSAVEPYVMDKMSPANREQMERLVGSIWETVCREVGESRGVAAEKLDQYASELSVTLPEDAVELGLVDRFAYEDEIETDQERVELSDYIDMLQPISKSKNRIAVLYMDGTIVSGDSESGVVGSGTAAKLLDELRKDDAVKGVVVRVNSPGGSALASDVIWRAMSQLRAEKPVVVSMGGVAASGGYYVSAPADVILCDKMTLTGSIGVFGVIPEVGGALRNKLGVTHDTARSNPHADLLTPMRGMDDAERTHVTRGVERVYTTFIGHVAQGRNMSTAAVDSLGGGRVWTGVDAVSNGLADGIGGLHDAILLCADRAGAADDFNVVEKLPAEEGIFAIVRSMRGRRIFSHVFGVLFGTVSDVPAAVIPPTVEERLETTAAQLVEGGVQARMPFEVEIL